MTPHLSKRYNYSIRRDRMETFSTKWKRSSFFFKRMIYNLTQPFIFLFLSFIVALHIWIKVDTEKKSILFKYVYYNSDRAGCQHFILFFSFMEIFILFFKIFFFFDSDPHLPLSPTLWPSDAILYRKPEIYTRHAQRRLYALLLDELRQHFLRLHGWLFGQ